MGFPPQLGAGCSWERGPESTSPSRRATITLSKYNAIFKKGVKAVLNSPCWRDQGRKRSPDQPWQPKGGAHTEQLTQLLFLSSLPAALNSHQQHPPSQRVPSRLNQVLHTAGAAYLLPFYPHPATFTCNQHTCCECNQPSSPAHPFTTLRSMKPGDPHQLVKLEACIKSKNDELQLYASELQ